MKINGLSTKEVLIQKEKGLINITQDKITKTNWQIVKDNLFTMFNAFNIIIGIFLFLVGAWMNMAYLAIIAMNVFIGIFQEIHAKKLVEKLSIISEIKALVIRDEAQVLIPVSEIVLNDVIVLSAGNQIPADSMIIHGEIEVNESLLTGEADSITKSYEAELLSGSFVVSGKCFARVLNVGADNFVSKLANEAKKHKKVNSELLNSMQRVTKFTGFFIIPIGITLFVQAYFFRNTPINYSVIYTAAALLGMLPKGLVLMISISLATGVIKLSKKKILVQQMRSIETLARVSMLCLDKTGTITEGVMHVSDITILNNNILPIPVNQAIALFLSNSDDNNATFLALKEHFGACCHYKNGNICEPDFSPFEERERRYKSALHQANATKNCGIISRKDDYSLVVALPSKETHSDYMLIEKTPFSSSRKYSSITFKNLGTLMLGAPEVLLGIENIPENILDLQKSGNRVLCFALSVENEIKPLATICLKDKVRESAKTTLQFFKNEGVLVKIISGDSALTVSSVAKEAGFEDYASYIDLSQDFSEDKIKEISKKYSIFGRVTPKQKSLLVKAFKEDEHTVCMTGDGVNDILALREADCSIAMGSGSDAAKQISHLQLLESDFSELTSVIMEGRRVVNNITRVAGIFFIKTIYSVLLSIFAIITMSVFPFIPIQITLIDASIEAYPAFFMSFEPDNRKITKSFLNTVIKFASPFSILILISFLVVTHLTNIGIVPEAYSQTIIYYITAFISILALIKSCRPFNKLRTFICLTAGIGFYVAAYLFSWLLHLEKLF